jgi:nitrite reductase (NADH) small subunit
MLRERLIPPCNGSWVSIGNVDQIPEGQGRCFKIGSRAIAVFRARDGAVYALDNTCPHNGGPLAEGLVGMEKVICPLHGYKFSLTGGQGLDNDLRVETYQVELRDESIYLRLPWAG